jgi:peroxiredoxin
MAATLGLGACSSGPVVGTAAPAFQAEDTRGTVVSLGADNDDVVVMAIHFDGEGDPAAYMAKHKYTFPVVADGSDVVRAYGITRIPTILVIDRSGTIVYKQVGFAAPDDLGAVADTVDESL